MLFIHTFSSLAGLFDLSRFFLFVTSFHTCFTYFRSLHYFLSDVLSFHTCLVYCKTMEWSLLWVVYFQTGGGGGV